MSYLSFKTLAYRTSVLSVCSVVCVAFDGFAAMMTGNFEHAQSQFDRVSDVVFSSVWNSSVSQARHHRKKCSDLNQQVPESKLVEVGLVAIRSSFLDPSLHGIMEALELDDGLSCRPEFHLVKTGVLAFTLIHSGGVVLMSFCMLAGLRSVIADGLRSIPGLSKPRVEFYTETLVKAAFIAAECVAEREGHDPSRGRASEDRRDIVVGTNGYNAYHTPSSVDVGSSGVANVTAFGSIQDKLHSALSVPAMKSLDTQVSVSGVRVDSRGVLDVKAIRFRGVVNWMADMSQDSMDRALCASLKFLRSLVGLMESHPRIIVQIDHGSVNELMVHMALQLGCMQFGVPAGLEGTTGPRSLKASSFFFWPKGGLSANHTCLMFENPVRNVCTSLVNFMGTFYGAMGPPFDMIPSNLALLFDVPEFKTAFESLKSRDDFDQFRSAYKAVLQADAFVGQKPPDISGVTVESVKKLLMCLMEAYKSVANDTLIDHYLTMYIKILTQGSVPTIAANVKSFLLDDFYPNFRGKAETDEWVEWANRQDQLGRPYVMTMGGNHIPLFKAARDEL